MGTKNLWSISFRSHQHIIIIIYQFFAMFLGFSSVSPNLPRKTIGIIEISLKFKQFASNSAPASIIQAIFFEWAIVSRPRRSCVMFSAEFSRFSRMPRYFQRNSPLGTTFYFIPTFCLASSVKFFGEILLEVCLWVGWTVCSSGKFPIFLQNRASPNCPLILWMVKTFMSGG